MTGPTNSQEYNDLLVHWTARTGVTQLPECDECGVDMTGLDVYEGPYGWYCSLYCCEHETHSGCGGGDDWYTLRAESGWGE